MKWFKRREPELSSVAKKILSDLDAPDLDCKIEGLNTYAKIDIKGRYYIRIQRFSGDVSIHDNGGMEIAKTLPKREKNLIHTKCHLILDKMAEEAEQILIARDKELTAKIFNEN